MAMKPAEQLFSAVQVCQHLQINTSRLGLASGCQLTQPPGSTSPDTCNERHLLRETDSYVRSDPLHHHAHLFLFLLDLVSLPACASFTCLFAAQVMSMCHVPCDPQPHVLYTLCKVCTHTHTQGVCGEQQIACQAGACGAQVPVSNAAFGFPFLLPPQS